MNGTHRLLCGLLAWSAGQKTGLTDVRHTGERRALTTGESVEVVGTKSGKTAIVRCADGTRWFVPVSFLENV